MPDTKISALTALTGAGTDAVNDLLPIVDTSAVQTKRITPAQLMVGMGAASTDTNTFTGTQSFDTSLVLNKTSGVGLKVDTTTPTYPWADLLGSVKTRTGGAGVPTFSSYQGNIYQWSFGTGGTAVEVFNEFHIPHDYAMGTDMYVHTHWSTAATPTGDINWLFDISYAKGYNQAAFEGTASTALPITVSVTQTSTATYKHMIAEVQFSATNGEISPATVNVSITSGTATLTAASSLFTAADIGRTVRIYSAGAGGTDLDTTISAYTSATQVTLANNASTTVTTQDAFRYRVLDTSLLEVDGLILVRIWRQANRTADTLDVAPFLHHSDIHYQTTSIGTKQKNGPAFWT